MRTETFKVLEEVFAMLPPELTLRVKEEIRHFNETAREDINKEPFNQDLRRLQDIGYNAAMAANNVLIEQMELGLHRSE